MKTKIFILAFILVSGMLIATQASAVNCFDVKPMPGACQKTCSSGQINIGSTPDCGNDRFCCVISARLPDEKCRTNLNGYCIESNKPCSNTQEKRIAYNSENPICPKDQSCCIPLDNYNKCDYAGKQCYTEKSEEGLCSKDLKCEKIGSVGDTTSCEWQGQSCNTTGNTKGTCQIQGESLVCVDGKGTKIGCEKEGNSCTTNANEPGSCKKEKDNVVCVKNNTGSNSNSNSTTEFPNPLRFTKLNEVVNEVLKNLRADIIVLAIVFIVIGALMYMMSAGNEKMIERAKMTITAAVIGLAIALAAPSFLKEIMTILGGNPTTTENITASSTNIMSVKDIAMGVLNLLLSIVGVVGIISLIVGGVIYLTAFGDEDRVSAGKRAMAYAIIGITLALGALVIVKQIAVIINPGQ
ncbi:MAG: pilin [Candidatus Moranbacteria bacterium]|nr:pilin [Candidatus Moranbacteria bacterium]